MAIITNHKEYAGKIQSKNEAAQSAEESILADSSISLHKTVDCLGMRNASSVVQRHKRMHHLPHLRLPAYRSFTDFSAKRSVCCYGGQFGEGLGFA